MDGEDKDYDDRIRKQKQEQKQSLTQQIEEHRMFKERAEELERDYEKQLNHLSLYSQQLRREKQEEWKMREEETITQNKIMVKNFLS